MLTPPSDHVEARERMRRLERQILEIAEQINLLFVTNLRRTEMVDRSGGGVVNAAQYYTRQQADDVIYEFQKLGLTVDAYFSEEEFFAAVLACTSDDGRHKLVFTTAEGGTGSGRRALVPAFCNLVGLPVLNSGAHACSIARHKFHASSVLRRAGVRVPEIWQFNRGRWIGDATPPTGAKVIVKPTYESMSIGVGADSVRMVDSEFPSFVEAKERELGQPVVVQEFVTGEEVGVPMVRIERTYSLPPVSFRRGDGQPFGALPRTFDDENVTNDTSYAEYETSAPEAAALVDAAVSAFDSLEMAGVGRIDFRVDPDGRPWVIDTNESPPPLADSSYASAMRTLGFSLPEMLAVWIGVCLYEAGVISGV
jgi:D-alanine-D-alanine ligase